MPILTQEWWSSFYTHFLRLWMQKHQGGKAPLQFYWIMQNTISLKRLELQWRLWACGWFSQALTATQDQSLKCSSVGLRQVKSIQIKCPQLKGKSKIQLTDSIRYLQNVGTIVRKRMVDIPRGRKVSYWHHATLNLFSYICYKEIWLSC